MGAFHYSIYQEKLHTKTYHTMPLLFMPFELTTARKTWFHLSTNGLRSALSNQNCTIWKPHKMDLIENLRGSLNYKKCSLPFYSVEHKFRFLSESLVSWLQFLFPQILYYSLKLILVCSNGCGRIPAWLSSHPWCYSAFMQGINKRWLFSTVSSGGSVNLRNIQDFQSRWRCRQTTFSPPGTTIRWITTNFKKKDTQNCQKIELYGSLTTKDLKKPYSSNSRRSRDGELGQRGCVVEVRWEGRDGGRRLVEQFAPH